MGMSIPYYDVLHPGHVVGRRYWPRGQGPHGSGAANTLNTMKWMYAAVHERITIDELTAKVVANVAAKNFQLAVASLHPTTKLPYKLLSSTPNMLAATVGRVHGLLAVPVQVYGGFWLGLNTDDSTFTLTTIANTGPGHMAFIGSATESDNTMGSAFAALTAAQTFGTWPADMSATAWAEATVANAIMYRPSSVP